MAGNTLWYDKPANLWDEAMPIGNGRLGAMIRGTTNVERFWVNEDSVWYGGPQTRVNPAAKRNLPKIRELIDQNQINEAEALTLKSFTAMPEGMRHYEPLGDVYLQFGHGTDPPGPYKNVVGIPRFENQKYSWASGHEPTLPAGYRRELDLHTGLATVSYEYEGVQWRRQVFTSIPDEVIVASVTADHDFSFSLQLTRGDHDEYDRKLNKCFDSLQHIDGGLILAGSMGGKGAIQFALGAKVYITKGTGTVEVDGVDVSISARAGAQVIALVAGETTYRNTDEVVAVTDRLSRAAGKSWTRLLDSHIAIFSPLYSRVTLTLPDSTAQDSLPIPSRLARVRDGDTDNGLTTTLFNFGRYLLISSALSGLPPNLQGIWNADAMPVWGSGYTININTQMNYWPAEVTNLAECHQTLFDFMEKVAARGADTARDMYGCRGWVVHHNTDLWADTAPKDQGICASYWNLAGAWFCTHMWEHYLFGRDTAFLERAYPIMRGSALFFIDFLVERDGQLITSPSLSAENSYYIPGTERRVGSLCAGPAWDAQILTELFTACSRASRILQHASDTAEYDTVLAKLPRPQIGRHGTILEWRDDVDEVEIGHRHISHLWGLYPGSTIHGAALHAAAQQTLERRLSQGGGHTSWSLAWILTQYARLRLPRRAHEGIQKMLAHSTLDSLLTTHPPFQIDGNFGFAAAVAEMLVQSHEGKGQGETVIELLPCLVEAWAEEGSVRGLRARGAVEVDVAWREGKLREVRLRSKLGEVQTRVVRVASEKLVSGSGEKTVTLEPGKEVVLSGEWA